MASKVNPGDPVTTISASHYNDTIDMVAWWKRNAATLTTNRKTFVNTPDNATRVFLKNASDALRRQGEVLKIGTLLTTDVAHVGLNAFSGSVPEETTDEVAVLLAPINYGVDDVGLCQVSGVVPALVDIQTEGDKWAVIEPDSAVLKSAASAGTFPILYAPASTGEQECVILMDKSAPAPGVPFKNISGYECPPYGVMELVEIVDGVWHVTRPTARREANNWLVNNSDQPVANDATSSNGSWGFDGCPVLASDISQDYTSETDPPYMINASFAPKPGYWHLQKGAGIAATPSGLYTGSGGYHTEDFGFKFRDKFHQASASFEYDFGAGSVTVNGAWQFVQQTETPEVSHIIPIRQGVYSSVSAAETWMTANNRFYIRALQTEDSTHSRLGLTVTSGSTTERFPFKLFRRSFYAVEVKLHLEIKGNVYSSAFANTADSGGDTYHKITLNALKPGMMELWLEAGSATISQELQEVSTHAGARIRVHSLPVVAIHVDENETTRLTIHTTSYMSQSSNLDEYIASDATKLGVFLRYQDGSGDSTRQYRILSAVDPNTADDGQEGSFVKITRLRTHPVMRE